MGEGGGTIQKEMKGDIDRDPVLVEETTKSPENDETKSLLTKVLPTSSLGELELRTHMLIEFGKKSLPLPLKKPSKNGYIEKKTEEGGQWSYASKVGGHTIWKMGRRRLWMVPKQYLLKTRLHRNRNAPSDKILFNPTLCDPYCHFTQDRGYLCSFASNFESFATINLSAVV